MELIPAIDLYQGRCVRLYKGRFDAVTHYDRDPVELARDYAAAGARWLHVVDLDGARDGRPGNAEVITRILDAAPLAVQVGGGLRTRDAVDTMLAAGASRVVVGSVAVREPDTVRGWLDALGGERVVLALDVRFDGDTPRLLTDGWTADSGLALDEVVDGYRASGLRHVLCTDVERDGALEGPAVALYAHGHTRFPDIAWQASGGVRDTSDLAALRAAGAAAAISGRALLDSRLALEDVTDFLPAARAARTG